MCIAQLTQKGCYYLLINCIVYNVQYHHNILSIGHKEMLIRIHGTVIGTYPWFGTQHLLFILFASVWQERSG